MKRFHALARKLEGSMSELADTRDGFEKARSFASL